MSERPLELTRFVPDVIISHGKTLPSGTEVITKSATGNIEYVGDHNDAQRYMLWELYKNDPLVQVGIIDGGVLLPAITDTHDHPTADAIRGIMEDVDLNGIETRELLLAKLKEDYDRRRDEGYEGAVIARNWDTRIHVTREDLDSVFPDRALFILDPSNHGGVANTVIFAEVEKKLEKLKKKPLGTIHADGRMTESYNLLARDIATQSIPPEEVERFLETMLLDRMSNGTMYTHDMGFRSAEQLAIAARLKKSWERERGTPFPLRRVYMYPSTLYPSPAHEIEQALKAGHISEEDISWIGVKLITDGTIGSRTAHVSIPYEDDPGNVGLAAMSLEEMVNALEDASRLGVSEVAIHAIGDVGISNALLVAERWRKIAERHHLDPRKIRISHFELPIPFEETFRRMRDLEVWADMEPNFLTDYIYKDRFGDRITQINPHRLILDSDVRTFAGTDRMPASPLFAVWCAVNAAFPSQALTTEEALGLFTHAPAEYEESPRGTIEEGKRADILVFDRSMLEHLSNDPSDILIKRIEGDQQHDQIAGVQQDLHASLRETVMGGKHLFSRP